MKYILERETSAERFISTLSIMVTQHQTNRTTTRTQENNHTRHRVGSLEIFSEVALILPGSEFLD